MTARETSLRGVPAPYKKATASFDPRRVFSLMLQARVLEERLIRMAKSDDGYFWIGGPGEEAFNIPLGLSVKRGQGLDHDFLHLHYRSSAILTAMGSPMIDFIRQMASKATDPFTGGRNFVNHVVKKEWNVVPGSSPIEVQYTIAPGTAWAQKRHGGDGITIVNGGDAGTAEGDFAICLNWASRPKRELPMLIIVTNNQYGISTPFDEVHGDRVIARRGEPFGIRWDTVDGNDPFAAANKLAQVMAYIRKERKPFVLEAYVSRLHGHSSSSGAERVQDEPCCVTDYAEQLEKQGVLQKGEADAMRKEFEESMRKDLEIVQAEPKPDPASIFDHTFVEA